MTPELIAACTGCKDPLLARKYAFFLTATMTEFDINTPVRQAAYLAQIGHESGGLQWFHELWGPTEAQKRYEPPGDLAMRLGNTMPGDGHRFAGRGPIQITGRYMYRLIGEKMGLELEDNPALLDDPETACRSSGAFWQLKNCNVFADAGNFLGLTKRINGGTNGYVDRLTRWTNAKGALHIPPTKATP